MAIVTLSLINSYRRIQDNHLIEAGVARLLHLEELQHRVFEAEAIQRAYAITGLPMFQKEFSGFADAKVVSSEGKMTEVP